MNTKKPNPTTSTGSRREFLKGSAGVFAGASAAQLLPQTANAQEDGMADALRDANANGRPILLRNGIVYSVDAEVGNYSRGDILIQGKIIRDIGQDLEYPSDTLVIDSSGMIVMPGFIDTHHHQYETILRGILADGMWGGVENELHARNYGTVIQAIFTPLYTPDDARISQLIASLSQISQGVTTTVDTSQIHLTSEHTDATIEGLRESGRRCLVAYNANRENADARRAPELRRLREQYFSSDDQLLTLAYNSRSEQWETWHIGRDVGASIVGHCQGRDNFDEPALIASGEMGPDVEYIHCTRISDGLLDAIADTGGHVSIATAIEMQMGHGYPPIQRCLDHGIRPSLSVDVECNMTADPFTQLRSAFTWQRALVNERSIQGEDNLPPPLTCQDVIEFHTVQGARAAQLDAKVGTLTPGKEADIIMLSTGLNVAPLHNVPGAIVTLMDTSNVQHVFIAGKIMKWRGALVQVDEDRVIADANAAAEGLVARAEYQNDLFETCCGGGLLSGEERPEISVERVKRGP